MRKSIIINCKAHFDYYRGSYNRPELKMCVDEIESDMFILTNTGRWFHHGGKELNCVSNDIEVSGSRFCYEGEIHPCSGYEPNIDMEKDEAKFTILATIYNKITKERKEVIFEFVTNNISNNEEIIKYMSAVKEFNKEIEDGKEKANKLMDFLNS